MNATEAAHFPELEALWKGQEEVWRQGETLVQGCWTRLQGDLRLKSDRCGSSSCDGSRRDGCVGADVELLLQRDMTAGKRQDAEMWTTYLQPTDPERGHQWHLHRQEVPIHRRGVHSRTYPHRRGHQDKDDPNNHHPP